MDFAVHSDPLYQWIKLPTQIQNIMVTPQFMRLQHVAHSSLPSRLSPLASTANKFNHSLGVWHLATIVEARSEFRHLAPNIQFAAMLHDVASPCFTHLMCARMQKIIGKSHENMAADILQEEPLCTCIQRHGGDIKIIADLIDGKFLPWGNIVNGPLDVDNIDGIPRFGLKAGLWSEKCPCDPAELAKSMTIKEGRIVFEDSASDQIDAWLQCRWDVMDAIHDEAAVSDAMLWRAVDMVASTNELSPQVFRFTDGKMMKWLSENSPLAERILNLIGKPETYKEVFKRLVPVSIARQAQVECSDRTQLANLLASEASIGPEYVAVYVDIDRRYRTVPMESGENRQHPRATSETEVHIGVYVHPAYSHYPNCLMRMTPSSRTLMPARWKSITPSITRHILIN
ncbi:MAG: hypothetical protein HYZ63_03190 [Candidatus Andersenbacteria bacterium]|nr:hypothetical protein [Candidatus Andersenbacteria bacterium]